jgi:hypothetical protein
MQTAVCLICVKPDDIWIEFLSKFSHYKVFVVIDSPEIFKSPYESITYIQIPNEECIAHGFSDMNFLIKKQVTGWEKAVYYFSLKNKEHGYVWFLEEDVFIYGEKTLLDIDYKYPKSDLLTRTYKTNETGRRNLWHWASVNIKLNPPYYEAMVCICRLSQPLLSAISEYASTHKKLFFLEALFPTIAKQKGLVYDTPSELDEVVYGRNLKTRQVVNKTRVFHPFKNISTHRNKRKNLNKTTGGVQRKKRDSKRRTLRGKRK